MTTWVVSVEVQTHEHGKAQGSEAAVQTQTGKFDIMKDASVQHMPAEADDASTHTYNNDWKRLGIMQDVGTKMISGPASRNDAGMQTNREGSATLIVSNVQVHGTQLFEKFSRYGHVVNAAVVGARGLVNFEHHDAAVRALQHTDCSLLGGKEIRVSMLGNKFDIQALRSQYK